MKNTKKVELAVEICMAGLSIPEGSSTTAEIRKIGRGQGISSRTDVNAFVNSVKYRVKRNRKHSARCASSQEEEFARVPNKWYKFLLFSVIIIAILFSLFHTMVTVEQPATKEPRFRVCLTLFKSAFSDGHTVKTLSDD